MIMIIIIVIIMIINSKLINYGGGCHHLTDIELFEERPMVHCGIQK